MTVDAIKQAIDQLPDNDRSNLAAWLNGLDDDAWEKQMIADFSPDGRGGALFEQVNRELHEGRLITFEEGRQQLAAKQDPLR